MNVPLGHETGEAREPRAHCYRCDKPLTLCLCSRIHQIQNRTPILILQHKRESRHPLGTVRIADLGLARCHVEVVPASARTAGEVPAWIPPGAGLLYPGNSAQELSSLSEAERPSSLLLLDGTWNQARALFRDHAWVQKLPRYRLTPQAPSRYRIRREPRPTYISTIEAIVAALSVLEPELSTASLASAFEHLIDDQIQRCHEGRAPRKRLPRPTRVRLLPRALVESFERLVIVYGEAARPEHEPEGATELVHWTALRVRDGATFDRTVRGASGPPGAARLKHLGLPRESFDDALELAELARAWRAFVEPGDVFSAWNPRTLELFGRALDVDLGELGLKGVYRRVRGGHGDLDQVVSLEAEVELPADVARALGVVRGRAALRLSNALRVVFLLRRFAEAAAR
jgi:DTW domain-containing protein YfiP